MAMESQTVPMNEQMIYRTDVRIVLITGVSGGDLRRYLLYLDPPS